MADEKKDTGYSSQEEGLGTVSKVSKFTAFKDSFKPAHYDDEQYAGLSQVEKAALATANSPLSRRLKNRHVQMIAIGGSIGTGLFIGTGSSLATGGPASVLLSFLVVGSALYVTVVALAELSCAFPVAGSFTTYSARFLDPAWSFAMGTNYALQWLAALPLELIAATVCAQYWNEDLNPASIVIIFWLFIAVITIFGGSRAYGEAEFILSLIKVIAVVGFIILGICITCGVGDQGYLGGKYWHDPGAFANGFKGFASTFVASSFAFSGTELIGLGAAEMEHPTIHLPRATRSLFIRILLFYVVSIIVIGCMVPYTNPQLLGSGAAVDIAASPFVIAIKDAGIKVLPSIFNAVILVSVLSVGNSSVYASSRTIAALGAYGQLPKICAYIDRKGRPMVGILITLGFGLICFVVAAGQDTSMEVLNWLMAISGLSAIFTWGSCCLCHFQVRMAFRKQGRSLDELPYRSPTGIYGSLYGFAMMVFILGLQFWIALFPLGSPPDAQAFFEVYLAFPIALLCYLGYKIWYRTKFIKPSEIDLDTGRTIATPEEREQEEQLKLALKQRPMWKRIATYWC